MRAARTPTAGRTAFDAYLKRVLLSKVTEAIQEREELLFALASLSERIIGFKTTVERAMYHTD